MSAGAPGVNVKCRFMVGKAASRLVRALSLEAQQGAQPASTRAQPGGTGRALSRDNVVPVKVSSAVIA